MSDYRSCACGCELPRQRRGFPRATKCLTCRLQDVETDLAVLRNAHARAFLPAALRSGQPPEVLTEAQQDAKSWKVIEAWYQAHGNHSALCVEFLGPFPGPHGYFVRLQGGFTARGNTRSDALAHAAQLALADMAPVRGMVSK